MRTRETAFTMTVCRSAGRRRRERVRPACRVNVGPTSP